MNILNVIIPVYNDSASIIDAVASAMSQINVDTHVIVINDGSTDDTEMVLQKSPYWEKIKYISKDNGGVASARNIGIKLSNKSDYICFLDSDDILSPLFASTLIEVIQSECADMAYSNYFLVDSIDPSIVLDIKPNYMSKPYSFTDILVKNHFMTPTVLVKSSLCLNEKFDECLMYNEDWLFWLKLLDKCQRIVPCSQKLVRIRTRLGGLTARKEIHAENYLMSLELIEKRYSVTYNKAFKHACGTYANDLSAFRLYRSSWVYLHKSFPSVVFVNTLLIVFLKIVLKKFRLDKFIKFVINRGCDRHQILI